AQAAKEFRHLVCEFDRGAQAAFEGYSLDVFLALLAAVQVKFLRGNPVEQADALHDPHHLTTIRTPPLFLQVLLNHPVAGHGVSPRKSVSLAAKQDNSTRGVN